jgi:hypothetical protein
MSQNRNSNLDRKVNVTRPSTPDPSIKEAQIQDPYIRDLVAKRAQQTHYGPTPLDREVKDVDMDGLMRRQMELHQTTGERASNIGEADIDRLFNRSSNHQQPQQHPQMMPHQQQQQGQQQVVLREGYPVYRPIQQGFGNTVILAREIGVVTNQLASQPFMMRGSVNVYVIKPNQTQVNIQEIQNNPRLLSQLVEVQAPPMASLGTLLVAREAIVSPSQHGNGRNMLTDSRQPQQYNPNNGRTVLRG